MNLTHLVMLKFFSGAGGAEEAPAVANSSRVNLGVGLGVGFCMLLGVFLVLR
jgi:hypothetical protein